MNMTSCELHELQISALLDGEANLHEQVDVLDHVLACRECRRFFEESRRMQDLVDESPLDMEAERLAGADSLDAGKKVRLLTNRRRRFPAMHRWGWAVAAVLLVTLGFWSGGLWAEERIARTPILPSTDQTIDVRLASAENAMSEARFVSLTLELLRADARYHQKMSQILRLLEVDGPLLSEDEKGAAWGQQEEGGYRIDRAVDQDGLENAEPEFASRTIY